MPTFLLYSLKAAGCLAVFYLFYKLLLSRDTLHRMNRVLLCGVLLLSFLLPLCVITVEKELPGVSAAGIDVIPENYFRRDMVFENRIPDDTRDLMIIEEPEPAPEPFDWGVLLGIIYFAGMFATLGWTVCNIVRVVRMTRRGRRIPLGNGSVLVLSDRIRAPFSWMRYVVMSEEDYACGGGTILVHEQAHQRLGHSWDLLLVDLLGCLQWFNPAMWLLRVELRAVHEYEADEQVLRCGVNAKDYQMLLIKKAVGGRWYSIANSLNHSNLKNRITMMLRKRSSRWARAKALYVLPLACLALGAFAQTSYVLPEDKTTKNSGNGEMPLPAGADDRMVGTPEGGMPPVEGSMAELLANLERTALEKQTAESGAHTFTGRVFGRDDKPWAGYEFICSGGRRVVTDAEGRFTIVTEKPIVYYLVGGETDQKVKSVGSRFGIPMGTDIALEFHLKESLALTHLPVSDEPVVYAVYGDPADFRFDPEHPPLIMDGGEELSAETLDTYLGLPEQKMIGAWMVKGPEALKGYGTRAANGVLSIRVQTYPYTESWSPADPSLWDPEDLELYLVWEGDELPEQFVARRDAYMKEEFAKLLTADAGKLERLGYKSVDGAEEWVTVEVSDGAALIPFWIDLSDEGLYLLDGEEIDYRQLGAISPSSIATATQMTSGEARRRYGDRGRYGAIVYTSRPESERVTIEEKQKPSDLYHYITGDFEPTGVPDTYRVQRIELSHSMPFEFRPLVLWNGKVSNIYLFTTPGIVHEIETVRIVTEPDEATVARYGVSARNGVIEVVSKTASREDDFEVTVYDKYNNPMRYLKGSFRSVDGKNTYKVSGLKLRNVQGVRPGMLPLVAVDGRVGSITDLEKIPARKIETIQIFSSEDVFHNPALVKRYGDAARVGAILVTTRDAAKLAEKEARKSGAGESVVASVPEGPSFGTVQTGNTPVDGQVKVRISEVAVPNDSLVVSGHDLSSMLFLLDGRRVAVAEVKALNEAEIESMSVLKDEWAVERYGEAAADGVVYVTTTEGARQFGRLECSFEHGNSFQEGPGFYRIKDTGNGFAIRPLNGARPLVLINGRQVDDDYLKSIDAGKVLWVRILQPGFELLDRYGERAWDGVIEFGTNESGERTTLAVYSSDASGKRNKMTVVREPSGASSGHSSVSKSIATSAQPLEEVTVATYTAGVDSVSIENGSLKQVGLIVLDGEEISADRLSQLDPSRIDAMTVLKGEQAVEHYGEKGAKGVIEITTKKNRSGVAGE